MQRCPEKVNRQIMDLEKITYYYLYHTKTLKIGKKKRSTTWWYTG